MKNTSALSAAALALVFTILNGPANAAVTIDIFQSGGNVVSEGSGTIDLTGLTLSSTTTDEGAVLPSIGVATVGAGTAGRYTGPTGPASFGTGLLTHQTSGSGPLFGIDASGFANPLLYLPSGYTSGTALSGTSVFDGQTIGSLGLTPGTYVYTWGGATVGATVLGDDSLTVHIGPTIPEPSTWAMMALGFGLLGGAGYWRRRSVATAA